MSEEKFEIGLRDVFNEVKTLSGQVAAYMQAQAPVIAVIQHRLEGVEGEVKELHAINHEAEQHRHEERRHRTVIRWTVVSSVIVGFLGLVGGIIALLAH